MGVQGRTLVMTGGSSLCVAVMEAARQRGYDVVFATARPLNQLSEGAAELLKKTGGGRVSYHNYNARDVTQMGLFRDAAMRDIGYGRPLFVVAGAAISVHGPGEDVADMRQVIVNGTANLLTAFRRDLKGDPRNRFALWVPIGSEMLGAGAIDAAFYEAKREAASLARGLVTSDPSYQGIGLFCGYHSPLDHPMTWEGNLVAGLLVAVVKKAGEDQVWRNDLASAAGSTIEPGASTEVIWKAVLGDVFNSPLFDAGRGVFGRDPEFSQPWNRTRFELALTGSEPVLSRVMGVHRALGITVSPARVAQVLLDTAEAESLPESGVVKIVGRPLTDLQPYLSG